MKRITITLTTMALLAGFGLHGADDKTTRRERAEQTKAQREAKKDIDQQIQAINKLDNKESALRAGMAAVSKETAVPLPTIEAEHKQHPKAGVAGLFVAHELSVHTRKPVETFLKQHSSGKSWTELAEANGEDLAAIEAKLTRIEQAMRGTSAASADSTDRTQVREADTKSSLDRRVQALNSADQSAALPRQGLSAVSKETAVPLPTLEEVQKQNPSAGLGDLFIAQELANQTQKPVSDFLKMHAGGKSWNEIVTAQNQSVADIEKKLDRLEQATREAK